MLETPTTLSAAELAELNEFAVEELETRLEMGTCFHFPCIERDWQGNCTLHGPSDTALYNITQPACNALGSDWSYSAY